MGKKIVLTGGGTAGHVIPNIAIIPRLKDEGYEIIYIGSINGIERKLIENENIKYYGISTGKFRRYFDLDNFKDPFKILKGIFEAAHILKLEKPNIVFSKGGFVSVPVIFSSYRYKIPVISHESDVTPGLANKICMPFVRKICVTFPETRKFMNNNKVEFTGTPIRKELFSGSEIKGKRLCRFKNDNPVILIMGGSQGSAFINNFMRVNMKKLLKSFNIIHICGKSNVDKSMINLEGYVQFEYVTEEQTHLFKLCDIVISRAGSNSIHELLALRKPNILIPLTKKSSRGDQILNAESFKKRGFSEVIYEEDLIDFQVLYSKIKEVYERRSEYISNMNIKYGNPIENIVDIITKNVR